MNLSLWLVDTFELQVSFLFLFPTFNMPPFHYLKHDVTCAEISGIRGRGALLWTSHLGRRTKDHFARLHLFQVLLNIDILPHNVDLSFHRFHSAVLLIDCWKGSYIAAEQAPAIELDRI